MATGSFSAAQGDVACTAQVIDLGKISKIASGVPFLDHMIDQLTSHAQLGVYVQVTLNGAHLVTDRDYAQNGEAPASTRARLDVSSNNDRPYDATIIRVCGEALGGALAALFTVVHDTSNNQGLPVCRGIRFVAPLDEAISEVEIGPIQLATPPRADAMGELTYSQAPFGRFPATGRKWVGSLRLELLGDFWHAVQRQLGRSLSVLKLRGDNAHHIVESSFKAFARVLRASLDVTAAKRVPNVQPSLASEPLRTAQKARVTKETDINVRLALDDKGTSQLASGLQTLDSMLGALCLASGLSVTAECRGDLFVDDHHSTEDVCIAFGQCLHEALGNKAGCNRMACATATEGSAHVEVIMDLSNRPYFEHNLGLVEEMVRSPELFFAIAHATLKQNHSPLSRGCVRSMHVGRNLLLCGCGCAAPNLAREVFRPLCRALLSPQVGDVSAEMIIHALDSLCTSARMTVHVRQLAIGSDVGSSYELVMATGRALGLAFRQCAAIDPRRAGMVTSSKGTLSV